MTTGTGVAIDKCEPPQSVDAEQAVLGSILKDKDVLDNIIDTLDKDSYFYFPKHRLIFQAILNLYNDSKPHDIHITAEELTRMDKLEDIGGRLYLVDLIDGVATTANAQYYADTVVEKYKMRKLITACNTTILECYRQGMPIKDIFNQLDSSLLDIGESQQTDIVHAGIVASNIVNDIEHRDIEELKSRYIETRITNLNNVINGIFKKHLTVIGGPSSMGKTSLALDIALYSNCKCLYIGLDETCTDATMRLLTSMTSINSTEMNDYGMPITGSKLDSLAKAATLISRGNIFLTEKTGLTDFHIRAMAKRHQRKYGLDMLIVDYIQQIADSHKSENRNLQVTQQVRTLKDIAKDLNIAVIAISQINRSYESHRFEPRNKHFGCPKMSQLRDSGTIEQEANMILFVWNLVQAAKDRGFPLDDHKIWGDEYLRQIERGDEPSFIVVAKNKMGKKAMVPCFWHGREMQFTSDWKRI